MQQDLATGCPCFFPQEILDLFSSLENKSQIVSDFGQTGDEPSSLTVKYVTLVILMLRMSPNCKIYNKKYFSWISKCIFMLLLSYLLTYYCLLDKMCFRVEQFCYILVTK